MPIDLNKAASSFKISLEKKGILKMPVMEMGVVMDVSGSFDDEHRDGSTNDVLTRLVPWGMTFDPDKKVDLFTFSGKGTAHLVGSVDEKNYQNYIPLHVIGKVPGYGLGTIYNEVTKLVLQSFGWLPSLEKAGGFLGGLFGKKKAVQSDKRRAIVFFVTDGDNNDVAEINEVIANAEVNDFEVFFVFFGISNDPGVTFSTLKGLDARYQNTLFKEVRDIKAFVKLSDDAVNEFFLGPKLLSWLKK